MDPKKYMTERRIKLSEQNESIKDRSVFDFNFLPEKPLVREESKQIIDALVSYEGTSIPTNQVILGSRGSGKTLTIKYIGELLKEDSNITILYANVRYYSTSFKILAHLLNASPRGLSLSELYDRFRKRFPSKTVVILDEVHLWSPKEKQREILYFLTRDTGNYQVIMLSINPRFLSDIDLSIKSTLQPELIHFKNYNAIEIASILYNRAKRGLEKPNEGVTQEIAAYTVKEANSDMRVGIKALYYWAKNGRQNVKECFDNARRDIFIDLIADLSDANIMILKAASIINDKFAKKVYVAYRDISKQNKENSISYVHFYNQLSYMQSLGLIILLTTKVDRTYANRIKLLCNVDVLKELYNLRFQ
ncbi:Cdc6/Cdc18 family protein [Candidatus Latescibacterota bacterium]